MQPLHNAAVWGVAVHDGDKAAIEGRLRERRPRMSEMMRHLVLRHARKKIVRLERRLRIKD